MDQNIINKVLEINSLAQQHVELNKENENREQIENESYSQEFVESL